MTELLRRKTLELVSLCKKAAAEGLNVVITGHDFPDADSIISAYMMQDLLCRLGVSSCIKLPTPPDNVTLRDVKTLGVWNDEYLKPFDDCDALLLVDHHNTYYKNRVVACVDHHTTPPAPTCECALVVAASSCGKVIYDMMRACGIAQDRDERLALYSVYLDTQSCRSTKFNKADTPWVEECLEKYGIDRDLIERMGFCLVSPEESIDVIAMYAYKRYEFDAVCASTVIQIDENDGRWENVLPIAINYLSQKTAAEEYAAWGFVVNKPMISRSDIYWIYRDGRVEKVALDRLASRTRDVIPVVSSIK